MIAKQEKKRQSNRVPYIVKVKLLEHNFWKVAILPKLPQHSNRGDQSIKVCKQRKIRGNFLVDFWVFVPPFATFWHLVPLLYVYNCPKSMSGNEGQHEVIWGTRFIVFQGPVCPFRPISLQSGQPIRFCENMFLFRLMLFDQSKLMLFIKPNAFLVRKKYGRFLEDLNHEVRMANRI